MVNINSMAHSDAVCAKIMRLGGLYNLVAQGGWNSTERYFREGMLALPYVVIVNSMAQAVKVLQGQRVRSG